MKFDFTDEQYALRDAARELFEKESSPARLRELWGGGARDARLWRAMGEMGLLGLMIPEQFGGMGGDEVDLVLVLEESGRAALPEPVIETVAIAGPMIAAGGSDDQKQEWLPRLASGDAKVTVQVEASPFVVDADIADALLIEKDAALHLVPSTHFDAAAIQTEDPSRRLFTVTAKLSDATRLGGGLFSQMFLRGAWATAAVLNGIAMRLLEMTVAHVKSRQQFGRPVGSFQAVKHKLASAAVLIESSRSCTWYAAYALAKDLPDAPVAISAAKAYASEAEGYINTEALQCHAGIGFTWEHDLHFWLKRGRALEQAYGSARHHRAILAHHVFDELDRGSER
ncbi:MAG: acyl-CoA dehydrogenase family protein [Actinomycetota bacterium]|nr:acyl-CoA/acyl-ACP dehydrogenase [Actinomycetota bacterium]